MKRHGAPKSKSEKDNYAKQAQQARSCVLQAKEYFDAANTSSLYTGPNHAYYGSIALTSLSMLILGDGRNALDQLRKNNENNHHGLDFTLGCNVKSAMQGINLLESSRAEILNKGHFRNWYNLLPARGSVHAITDYTLTNDQRRINYESIGGYDTPKIEQLKKKKTALDLIKYLPDLDQDLARYGVGVFRSRTNLDVKIERGNKVIYTWRIHGCRSESELEALLANFLTKSDSQNKFTWSGFDGQLSGIVRFESPTNEPTPFIWPSSRDTMSHESISYADMDETHELVDLYVLAYQFSMLSRYYPDIWVSCLESQCRAAKIIERANSIIIKKLPILILSVLRDVQVIISTHRAPWMK
ncbi:MAG: hypothetical protein KGO49_12545 [Gammaproteobacteria bacterium]|nr:hypothetical protein [Gammaproteobacteria bacterium]